MTECIQGQIVYFTYLYKPAQFIMIRLMFYFENYLKENILIYILFFVFKESNNTLPFPNVKKEQQI